MDNQYLLDQLRGGCPLARNELAQRIEHLLPANALNRCLNALYSNGVQADGLLRFVRSFKLKSFRPQRRK
jgi:hypothetical protein